MVMDTVRRMSGLSILDQFPEKYIWEPSEKMKQWWKEYEEKQKERLITAHKL